MKKRLLSLIIAIYSCISFAQTVPSYVPTANLVAWYPFTGNAFDSSGNGNNGTVYGATLTVDRFGNTNSAYSFDGIGQYISVPNSPSLNPNNSLTLNTWVYHYSVNSREKYIAKLNPSDASDFCYTFGYDAGNLHAIWQIDSCEPPTVGGVDDMIAFTFDTGVWNMYTMTLSDSGVINEYIDGLLLHSISTGQIYKGCDSTVSTLQFGYWWSSDAQWFNGKLDDMGIWSRALTFCEIYGLYHAVDSCGGLKTKDILFTPTNNISIYPNPTTSTLTITSPLQINQITITNLLGQVVYFTTSCLLLPQKSGTGNTGRELRVDVSGLPNGMYFVTVNGTEVRKFVKQ